MKFWEAMKALAEGKNVRCSQWPDNEYVDLVSANSFSYYQKKNGCRFSLSAHDDWELYQEPEKTFSFQEVVKGLMEGKRFKRPEWENGRYFFKDEYGYYRINFYGGEPWYLHEKDIEGTDWIEVK